MCATKRGREVSGPARLAPFAPLSRLPDFVDLLFLSSMSLYCMVSLSLVGFRFAAGVCFVVLSCSFPRFVVLRYGMYMELAS